MPHIDYYFTPLSPYTYLAGLRLEEIAKRHSADITYKPLDIIGLFARTGGQAPKDRHPARQAYRLEDLRRQAVKAAMALNLKPAFWPTNPAPASYALITAQKTGGGDIAGLVHGLARAVWAEDKDIAQDDVIRELLAASGFDPDLVDKGMMSAADEYARNLESAVAANVFGAPFYVVDDGAHFWGQDKLVDLDLHFSGKL